MDVRDGFIPGIFNYCDRWCSACAFTSRCRGFAMDAEFEAHSDSNMRALVELHREAEARQRPAWIQDMLEDVERAGDHDELHVAPPKPIAEAHQPIRLRAEAYCDNARRWLDALGLGRSDDPADPLAVIAWFTTYIPSKIHRAVFGLANDDGQLGEFPSDADGSAKAALVAIGRSRTAWSALAGAGMAAADTAARMLDDLAWLEVELERVFPKARAFVRPGFDEPGLIARLDASDE